MSVSFGRFAEAIYCYYEAIFPGILLSVNVVNIHCSNRCKTSIADLYRSCSSCQYDLCIKCCKEFRDGCLQGSQEEVDEEIVDPGSPYMHGIDNPESGPLRSRSASSSRLRSACSSRLRSKSGTVDKAGDTLYKTSSDSQWEPEKSGRILCPPKTLGGCGKFFLELTCLLKDDHVSDLLVRAEKVLDKCKTLSDSLEQRCSGSDSVSRSGTNEMKFLKAASREGSSDNYLYHPNGLELQAKDLSHFQYHWHKGEPVIVNNVLDLNYGLSWEPKVMLRAFGLNHPTLSDMVFFNCLNLREVSWFLLFCRLSFYDIRLKSFFLLFF